MIVTTSRVPIDDLSALGWEHKPEGLCRGDECVPLPASSIDGARTVDVDLLGQRLRRSVVADPATGVRSIGPEYGATTLTRVAAPDLELPDLVTGQPFRLSSLRGKKVVLVSWASW